MEFAHPGILWCLTLLIPIIIWYILKQRNMRASLQVSTTAPFARLGKPFKHYIRHALFAMRIGALACIIVALARPISREGWSSTKTEGTDIVIAMDISTSMLARDFKPDRLGAAKEVASNFINGREHDNMGVVIFAGESLTGLPMTIDRGALSNYIESITFNMVEDGTAIGDGLATSINRIKDGKAKSKSIILLTDGSNNTGYVDPLTAAEIAKVNDIKVYTIGIGTTGLADVPVMDYFGRVTYQKQEVDIDEATLKQIADITGGKYFRATGNKVLEDVFNEIDSLEKSELDVRNFSRTEDRPLTFLLLALALSLVGLEILTRHTVMQSIP